MLTAAQVREFLSAIGGQFYVDDLNKVPEGFRELFVPNAGKDKGYRLDGTEDVLGLKAAAAAARTDTDKVKAEFREFKAKYEGIDPEEAAKIRSEYEALKDKTVLDKDGIEALRHKHVADAAEAHKREKIKLEAERDELKAKAEENDRKYRQFRARAVVTEAVAKSKPNEDQIPDIVRRALDVFELDDQDRLIGYRTTGDGQRELWPGADGVSSLSPDEFVQHLQEKVPSFWPPSTGSGAGGARRGNGADWRGMTPEQQVALGLNGAAGR